jgi:hypothetical protein
MTDLPGFELPDENLIAADTDECPICGRHWRTVWAWRVTRWCVLLGLLALLSLRLLHR